MKLTTQRLQAVYHLHQARRALVGRLDQQVSPEEWARSEAAREHVDRALQALDTTPDQHKHPNGEPR